MEWQVWLGITAIVIASAALVVALGARSQQSRMRRQQPAAIHLTQVQAVPRAPRLLAFVANPSKAGMGDLEATVRAFCERQGLAEPLWYETTVEDPGTGPAKQAVEAGADVVVAAGGDGTVRAVAEALVGTRVPMGLLPMGTGNLLARNLQISVTSVNDALDVIAGGRTRTIDVGWARIAEFADPGPDDDTDREHVFLVIAGLGFDAAMVADADATLKRAVGWVAYFLAGLPHLHGRRMRARIWLDDTPPVDARLRSFIIGNCGLLPGGITLLPDAVVDDGILDVAAIDTRGGVVGWAQLTLEVVMQGFGVRNDLPEKLGRIDHTKARRARIRVAGGEQAQVDGDPLGNAVELETWVQPAALRVRVP
ncbi:NAD(+)/NADH kinase [Antribacter sp. KLBMP9083]|uniref:NAD(+)/NADH kinase n=1 Tax=Antribacter soli TaxID=2910976 RepID=A0AA41U6T9_9MICO|nr:diacylglycerol kinase family protein [Antribacter soli]MCF4120645.1 NAD(+)/NADH kinase [Antribacter soli]